MIARNFDSKVINRQYVCRWIRLKTKALEIRNALIKAHLVEIWKWQNIIKTTKRGYHVFIPRGRSFSDQNFARGGNSSRRISQEFQGHLVILVGILQ